MIGQPFGLESEYDTNQLGDQHLLATRWAQAMHGSASYVFDESQVSTAAMNLLAEHFLATACPARHNAAAPAAVTRDRTCGQWALRHCLASSDRFLVELLMRLVDRRGVEAHGSELILCPITSTHRRSLAPWQQPDSR